MNFRALLMTAVIACVGSITGRAHASEVLYEGSGFLRGTQSFVDSFELATAGTLTVTLSNIAWPQELANLSLVLSSPSGVLGPTMGAGTATFDVPAGDIFAQWFGTAQGPLNAGVYCIKIEFQPTAVPLPTSIALLLSGLGLLVWQRRARGDGSPYSQGMHAGV